MRAVIWIRAHVAGGLLLALILWMALAQGAIAQSFRFSSFEINGNQRVETGTILSLAGIQRGEAVSAAALNDAVQSLLGSGLFENANVTPRGNRLVIDVVEFPTINRVNIEGNRRLSDDLLSGLITSQSRRVYSPTQAAQDAAVIEQAYAEQGRLAATVTPAIIRRSENRVDLVFEVTEGRVVEIERISFTGNRAFSDRRLRRVLETKQAGIFRQFVRSDTFIADRIEFDKQVLRDFYLSRGYVDFETLGTSSELTQSRDAFLLMFNVREGQQFDFGNVEAVSLIPEVDAEDFQDAIRVRPGVSYSPVLVETTIERLERRALELGLNFIRIEPRITRNAAELALDVAFEISRGPRVFVERIDIEGNTTTLDRVVRRQFRIVEGDPFNPREIRQSAERIRALGFFATADVSAREGSRDDTVIVDVDVEEQPTGSLSFGASYGTNAGIGAAISFSERNFLGRGQRLSFAVNTSEANTAYNLRFAEPAFLGRDLTFGLNIGLTETSQRFADFNTRRIIVQPSLGFPVSERGRLTLRYTAQQDAVLDVDDGLDDMGMQEVAFGVNQFGVLETEAGSSALIKADEARGDLWQSSVGYSYSFDSRTTGLNPNAGVLFRFGQDFAGLGGDREFVRTSFFLGAEAKVLKEEVTVRAILEGGSIQSTGGETSTITERYSGNGAVRGFEPNGYGPRDLTAQNRDAVRGNTFAALRLEADFPLGLPEEYGISGGVYFDTGSVWGLDDDLGGTIDDDFIARSTVGFTIFWTTPIGPLRFNFSNPLEYEDYDNRQYFDLSVTTRF
ncbi:MAG: outer membrane protein assembly factor BamA [Pseudomonadota bacterium]